MLRLCASAFQLLTWRSRACDVLLNEALAPCCAQEGTMSLADLMLKLARYTGLDDNVNRVAINHFAGSTHARPRPYSMWSATEPKPDLAEYVTDYTSWPSLTNKEFSARHLPPAPTDYVAGLPPDAPYDTKKRTSGDVTGLFLRGASM